VDAEVDAHATSTPRNERSMDEGAVCAVAVEAAARSSDDTPEARWRIAR
jgi:hypothetical protein